MAENRLPRAWSKLVAQAELQVGVLRERAAALGLVLTCPETFAATITTAREAEAELRAAVVGWAAVRSERRRVDHEAWDFIALARQALALHLGKRWSERWCCFGFTRPTLRVPERRAARETVLECLADALDKHSGWTLPDLQFTAARARNLFDTLTGADARYGSAHARLRRARLARDAAVAALNKAMRHLIIDLSIRLSPTDPLWLEFNLNPPGDRRRKRSAKSLVPAKDATSSGTNVAAAPPPDSEPVPLLRANGRIPEPADEPSALPFAREIGPHRDMPAVEVTMSELTACEDNASPGRSAPSAGLACLPRENLAERRTKARLTPFLHPRSWWRLWRASTAKIAWNLF